MMAGWTYTWGSAPRTGTSSTSYPLPTGGIYNSPAFQTFLANHPDFARLARTGTHQQVSAFLSAHPAIGQRYLAIVRPPTAAAAGAPAAPGTPAPATPSANTTDSASNESALGSLTSDLAAYGLEAAAPYAWQRYLELGPGSEDTILNEIRQNKDGTGIYAQVYPGMAELRAQGRAMSEGDYRNAEETYRAAMRSYGLPRSMWDDPTDFAKLIVGGVSAKEFDARLQMAQRAALTDPRGQILRDELAKAGMPNATGLVAAWFIDPDKSEADIERQYTSALAQAVSQTTGFGQLTADQATRIGSLGLTEDAQAQTFGQIGQMTELTNDLPGVQEAATLTRDDLVSAAFENSATAQAKLQRKQKTRAAAFQGGGGYALGQAGVSGLGSANT